nr:integrase, catalytic region, zinc finger, CCHC-type, peptidase aspartic, catalytic [Tanacetum cinerariifolium]
MIMPSKDKLYNGRKGMGFKILSYFEKAKDLRPGLYDEKFIGLGARENKIEFAYDYGNLNTSYVNEKINFSDDYFQEIINPDFEKIDSPFQQTSLLKPFVPTVILEKIIIDSKDEVVSLLEKEKANFKRIESLKSKGFESSENGISESENQSENDCQGVEKECDNVKNSKVIALRMFKLNVSKSVLPISVSKTSCASENVENKTKKRHLDTFSSVRRPKHSGVIWKKKGSSNTSNVDLSSVSHSKLNKDVKRYSRKDLLSYNFLDDYFQEIINPDFEKIDSPFQQTSSLKPFVPTVILEKIIIDSKDEVVSLLEKEKANFERIESLKSKGFESSENGISESENQSENDCQWVEKECDNVKNSKVIAPRMFKLNVSKSVLPISVSKMSCASENVENKTKKRHLDTFSSVRRPKHSGVIWKKKGSSNTSNIVQICLWIIDSGCSKHMMGNRSLLTNFVEKFLRTVRFGNNDFAMIAGYKTQVNLQLQVQRVRTDNGTEFKNKTLAKFFDE